MFRAVDVSLFSSLKVRSHFVHVFIIAALIAAIFLPAVGYEWKYIEDYAYYVNNPMFSEAGVNERLVWCWTEHVEYNYMPVTWSLSVVLQGISKGAFILQVCCFSLHVLVSLLAYRLFRECGVSALVSLVAVLLFAVHPLRVESVVWASSFKGLLAAFFALVAIFAFVRGWFKRSVVFYILCVFSKQTLIGLPLLLLFCPKDRRPGNYIMSGYFVISVMGLGMAVWANWDNPSPDLHGGFILRPLVAVAAIGHYVHKTLVPMYLVVDYPILLTWVNMIFGLVVLGLVGFSFYRVRKSVLGLYEKCLIVFVFMILPVSGLVATPLEFAADRLSYFPSLFLMLALVSGLAALGRSYLWVLVVVIIPMSLLCVQQVRVWSDLREQSEKSLVYYSSHYLSMISLVHLEVRDGRFERAFELGDELTRVHPKRYGGWETLVKLHLRNGDPEGARGVLNRALREASELREEVEILLVEVARSEGDLAEILKILDRMELAGYDLFTIHYHRVKAHYDFGLLLDARRALDSALLRFPRSSVLHRLRSELLVE